jgi:hypothetical protein
LRHARRIAGIAQELHEEVHPRFGVLQPPVDFVHRVAGVGAAAARKVRNGASKSSSGWIDRPTL